MKIIYKVGNLLDAEESFIVHGCNAQGRMGSGVAKAIRDRYPQAYVAYHRAYLSEGLALGQTIWAKCAPHTVINAITQEFYGYDGRRYVDYDAVGRAFAQIDATSQLTKRSEPAARTIGVVNAVAMPLIGAGLAGGDWGTIAEIIEDASTSFQPVVYVLKESDIPDDRR